jgi:hypothetical protein
MAVGAGGYARQPTLRHLPHSTTHGVTPSRLLLRQLTFLTLAERPTIGLYHAQAGLDKSCGLASVSPSGACYCLNGMATAAPDAVRSANA